MTEALEQEAALWADMYGPGCPQSGPASAYEWREVAAYPIALIASAPDDWAAWFAQECQWADEDGSPDRYADLADGSPVLFPIVIVEVEGRAYLWDGYHRTAASVVAGRGTIPAIVGVRHPAT